MREELKNMSETELNQLEEQVAEEAVTVEDIRSNLKQTKNGTPRQTIYNCLYVLRHDPVFGGAFRKNLMTGRTVVTKKMAWHREGENYTDVDEDNLKLYLEEKYALTSEKKIRSAVNIVANENGFHPIREMLESLTWDGKERIRYALSYFLGADSNNYVGEVMTLHMLAAIHRVYKPGCKYDICLCLVGPQGCGKSTFFRFLAIKDEWFCDDLKKVDDDNVYRKLQGHWFIEFGELNTKTKAQSIEEFKAFLTRQKETYKTPYDKYPQDHLRQCVFCGTSNDLQFLPFDRSGNRRFAPVLIDPAKAEHHILENEQKSRAYIEQMWAEAMYYYREEGNNLKLTFSKNMEGYATSLQKEFMPEDSDLGMVEAFLEKKGDEYTCVKEIYCMVFNHIFSDSIPAWESKRIADMLRELGWKCIDSRKFAMYGSQKAWVKIVDPSMDAGDGFVKIAENETNPFDQKKDETN